MGIISAGVRRSPRYTKGQRVIPAPAREPHSVTATVSFRLFSLDATAEIADSTAGTPCAHSRTKRSSELTGPLREAYMIIFKNVLVATDFSEPSDSALDYGRELARRFNATLHVLHVTDSVYLQYTGDAYVGFLPELQSEIEDAARTQLDALLTADDRRDLRAKPVVLTGVSASRSIVDYSREQAIDLIVLGTHGRGAIGHLLMGSVAERVVRTAPCPVLTVHRPEREFVLADAQMAVAHA